MNSISINGKVIVTSGHSVIISNGKIIIDDKDVTPDASDIKIEVHGNLERLEVDCCEYVKIVGDTGPVKTVSGAVEITGDVNGDISTVSGAVRCKDIRGSVSTISGSIR